VRTGIVERQAGRGQRELADTIDAGQLQLGEPARFVERDRRGCRRLGQFGKHLVHRRLAAHQGIEHAIGVRAMRRDQTQAGDGNHRQAFEPAGSGAAARARQGRSGDLFVTQPIDQCGQPGEGFDLLVFVGQRQAQPVLDLEQEFGDRQ
jgi:hypothetical protein